MAIAETLDAFLTEVPEEVQERFHEIVTITDRFCSQHLDDEFRDVCRRLATCLCQPESPVHRGKAASWAAGIVYEAGQINFLGDQNPTPRLRSEEIARGCGVSTATMHSKGRDIREALGLTRFDLDFTIPSLMRDNPLAWLMQLPNGAVVDVRNAPASIREHLDSAGLLPSTITNPPAPAGDWRERKLVPPPTPRTDVAYQIQISLRHIEPPIWRRLLVPDCTLGELHQLIQATMDWENCHLHEFIIAKRRFQSAMSLEFDFPMDAFEIEEEFLLSQVLPVKMRKPFQFKYVYDFGDYWEHDITVEKIQRGRNQPTRPVCLEGQRAAPPEDCGGPWGYISLLETLADPKHPEYEDMLEWCGPIDPEDFCVDDINKRLTSWTRLS